MQFNSHANNEDLYSDARWWCGLSTSDTTSYPVADFTRNANRALAALVPKIMRADGKWEWSDSNNTDLDIATTNLVASQVDYTMAVTHLKILKVRVKDTAGNWITLAPMDRTQYSDSELRETGTPRCYDKTGNSIIPFPLPNYSSTSGLEVQVQRGASYFATTDTTKVPGIAEPFHRLISLNAALDYTDTKDLEKRSVKIRAKIADLEKEMVEFYSSRPRDEKSTVEFERDDYGSDLLSNQGIESRKYRA